MARRSDFERIPKDKYYTFDPKAGAALQPFIEEDKPRCLEPFAGAGDLMNQTPYLYWAFASDIEPNAPFVMEKDYTWWTPEKLIEQQIEYVVTNPPWKRDILHKAIPWFADHVPTWFLLDANWAWTKQAEPFISKYCTDIVTIGRLKWIPNTNMSGKDDCAWFKFDINKNDVTRFYGRV